MNIAAYLRILVLGGIFSLVGCQTQDSVTADPKLNPSSGETTTEAEASDPVQPNLACPECGKKREFRGEFIYFADAAVLTECGAQHALSVEINPKIELAYEIHRSAPAAPLYFVATGQVEIRPSMEEGLMQKRLIIDGDNWYFDAFARCD